jgi:copper(I)-binding protein
MAAKPLRRPPGTYSFRFLSRTIMHLRSIIISSAMLLISFAATAHDHRAGGIRIDQAYARSTVPGQTSGAAYLTLENKGDSADKLVSIASPVARSVEIHTMSMDGNIMKMREVSHIDIKPSAKVAMRPGDGYHVMLIGLRQALNPGDKVPLTLSFEKSGKVEVSATVEGNAAKAGGAKAGHHRH